MKNILIIGAILIVIGVGGYALINSNKSSNVNMATKTTTSKGNTFTSIKDALSKSVSLQCDYKNEKGVVTKVSIKAGAVRMAMVEPSDKSDQPGEILMKDNVMYMWSDKTKKGMKYSLESMKEQISAIPQAKEQNYPANQQKDKDSVVNMIEKYKDMCKPAVLADSTFALPTDVTFQDMDAMMKQMRQMPTGIPTNGSNSADYQKQVEDMMKQYQGQ